MHIHLDGEVNAQDVFPLRQYLSLFGWLIVTQTKFTSPNSSRKYKSYTLTAKMNFDTTKLDNQNITFRNVFVYIYQYKDESMEFGTRT